MREWLTRLLRRRLRARPPSMAVLTADGSIAPPAVEVPEGLALAGDTSAATWIEEALAGKPWASVASLLPDGFPAYVRILHPAYLGRARPGNPPVPVRWAEVAARTGSVLHPLVQFARLARLGDDANAEPSWGGRPVAGSFEGIEDLASLLAAFTETRERVWFCVWEGYGGLDMIPSVATSPRVRLPGRDHVLLTGPLAAVASFRRAGAPWDEGSNLWWPDDRAWCVATDVDLDSTYVGGSEECIAAILASERFEALPARSSDRVNLGADEINL